MTAQIHKRYSLKEELLHVGLLLDYYIEQDGASLKEQDMIDRLIHVLLERHMELMEDCTYLEALFSSINQHHPVPVTLYTGNG